MSKMVLGGAWAKRRLLDVKNDGWVFRQVCKSREAGVREMVSIIYKRKIDQEYMPSLSKIT